MSHLTHMQILITDLEALRKACEDCDCSLERRETFRAYRAGNRCALAVKANGLPKAYEAGVVEAAATTTKGKTTYAPSTGGAAGYLLQVDDFIGGNGMVERIGEGGGKLLQRYAYRVARKIAQQQGQICTVKTLPDGTLQLELEDAPEQRRDEYAPAY